MRLVILDDKNSVGEWAAKYVSKRIKNFNPGPEKCVNTWTSNNSSIFNRFYL